MTPTIRVFHAPGCHLCESALGVIQAVCGEDDLAVQLVDITGDAELERSYRERIPVVEIDGVEAFRYFVHPEALRRRLGFPHAR